MNYYELLIKGGVSFVPFLVKTPVLLWAHDMLLYMHAEMTALILVPWIYIRFFSPLDFKFKNQISNLFGHLLLYLLFFAGLLFAEVCLFVPLNLQWLRPTTFYLPMPYISSPHLDLFLSIFLAISWLVIPFFHEFFYREFIRSKEQKTMLALSHLCSTLVTMQNICMFIKVGTFRERLLLLFVAAAAELVVFFTSKYAGIWGCIAFRTGFAFTFVVHMFLLKYKGIPPRGVFIHAKSHPLNFWNKVLRRF